MLARTNAHPFELSGLGLAPYRLLYVASFPSPSLAEQNPEAYNNACRMLPRDVPLGICNHCGMTLMHNFVCQSADGNKFVVGSDCVMGTKIESGIKDPFAVRIEVERKKIEKRVRRARADAKDEAVRAEWAALIDAPATVAKLSSIMVPGRPWVPGEQVPLLDSLKKIFAMCGASGRARTLKTLKQHLAA